MRMAGLIEKKRDGIELGPSRVEYIDIGINRWYIGYDKYTAKI